MRSSRAPPARATPGTSRSTKYFGGGTRAWTSRLIVAAGRCRRAMIIARRRPEREWIRLWTSRPARSRRESSAWLTALRVWRLIVIGLG